MLHVEWVGCHTFWVLGGSHDEKEVAKKKFFLWTLQSTEIEKEKENFCFSPVKSNSSELTFHSKKKIVDMQIFQSLVNDRKNKNVVFSPFSLKRALTLVQEGADMKSLTYKQLTQFLSSNQSRVTDDLQDMENYVQQVMSKKNSPLKVTQVILWNPDKAGSIQPKYVEAIGSNTKWLYTNDHKKSQALKTLNKEICLLTNGNIPELVVLDPEELSQLAFILANAIYFKANWYIPFDKELTKVKAFRSPYQKDAKVNMMTHEEEIDAFYAIGDNGTAIAELMYEKKDAKSFRFGLILPKDSQVKSSWETYLSQFSAATFQDMIQKVRKREIELHMPKFEVKEKFDNLQPQLESSGLTSLFSSATFDFSRATLKKTKDLFISKVVHQVSFQADELGTVASAATAVVGSEESMRRREKPVQMILDRPFIYYLRDVTQDELLFLGIKSV